MKLYHVCNDYSLCSNISDKSAKDADSSNYKWTETERHGIKILLGSHRKYKELHYAKINSDTDYSGNYL